MTSFPARIVPTSTVLSAVAILASYSQAQTCDLEHDFVTTSGPSSSVPTAGARIDGVDDPAAAFAELGGHRYFRATTLGAGAELWRTDGTAAGTTLVADLEPGPAGSEPSELTVVGGELFFVATTAAHGSELWKSDGTAAGTVLVHDLVAGPGGSDPGNLIALGGKLCFGATTAAAGREPWVTDGTAAGSGLLAQTGFGNLDGGFLRPTLGAGGGYVLFHVLAGPGASPALWRTDGTPAGTFALASMAPGAGTSDLSSGFHLGGDTLLALPTIAHGTELWRTDGTVAGTSLAHEFAAGAADGMEPLGPRAAAVHGGLLHLAARDGAGELRLFATDGTSAGTSQVIGSGHAPADLVAAAGDLFYTASLPATGRELWRLAGGSAAMVAEAFGGPIDGIPTGVGQLTPLGSGVAYVAFDPIGGMELHASDGTAAGTGLVRDLLPGFDLDAPAALTPDGSGGILFAGLDDVHGIELWASDGTTAGTDLVLDLEPATPTESSYFEEVIPFGTDGLLMSVLSDGLGVELWSWTPAAGAQLVKDIAPGPQSGHPRDLYPAWIDGEFWVYFSAEDKFGRELWRTDGTTAGTERLTDINIFGDSNPGPFHSDGHRLFFGATGTDGLSHLNRLEGPAGPAVFSPVSQANDHPREFVDLGGATLFAAELSSGATLLRFDPATMTTQVVLDIYPGGSADPHDLVRVGDEVFFAATDPVHGEELWTTDGTAGGTQLVADIFPGPGDSRIDDMIRLGDEVWFLARSAPSYYELFRSDGTAAGTTAPFSVGGSPSGLVASDGRLFYTAYGPGPTLPGGEPQLFVTDGTSAGTVQLTSFEFEIGFSLEDTFELLPAAGGCYFVPAQASPGGSRELHFSDGTVAGTQVVCDLAPGQADSVPTDLVLSGGDLLFHADTPLVGRELFRIQDVGAYVKDLGPAAVSGTLVASTPTLGGSVQVDVLDGPIAAGPSLGLLLFSPATAQPNGAFVAAGEASWIDPLGLGTLTVFAGAPFSASYPLPADGTLAGVALNLQAWFLPLAQPLPARTSNGLRLVLGS